MLSSSLRRNACHSSLQNFQKCLLYTFTGNITGDGYILRLTCDLIDLIDINNSVLRTVNIIVSSLDNFQKDILNILAYISGLCQCSGICNGKWHIQKSRQCLCKQGLTGTSWSQHQNVALLKLHIQVLGCSDTFVMIVYSNRKCFLGLILSDYIVVQNCMDFLWFHQIDLRSKNIFLIVSSKFFLHDLRADTYTLIADVGPIRSGD